MTSIVVLTLFIISDLSIRINGKLPRSRNMQKWRTPSAFQLARIQQDYEMDYEFGESETDTATSVNDWLRRDEVVSDAECLERCNNRLNVGMDMVNAHMAFGSIDVPSVVERRDLKLFCLLDQQHSQCVDECGYTVQFNLREYVCKNRFEEMSSHLACYSRAAPVLARHCRPRCGHYSPLQHTFSGYGQRCRQLLCDHACANFIINKVCRLKEARSAAAFLLEFTRMQAS
ncbi:hypothetical protein DICVIV_10272 [Dictyocaulus viviparus]|uniref:Chondroitin proteoglycan 4 domain-containing protein n=1 Tax=Dictyocaulus viviparus TaxID=29172 RepID=A0A0D8XGJ9_DICVI|nr:hypothetical protein DICVIV_10272 [Dictyocaulus viviparus]